MEFRRIEKKDEQKLYKLFEEMEITLENKDWWLPLSENEKTLLFNEENAYFLGLYYKEKLVGCSVLLVNNEDFKDYLDYLDNLDKSKCGKIGRCVVHPEYRNNNYMYKLNSKLVEIAKNYNLKHLIAITHPDNIASNKSMQKLGMKNVKTILRYGKYTRSIYLIDII